MVDEIIKLLEYLMGSELVHGLATVYIIGCIIALLLIVLIFIVATVIIARAFRRTKHR